MKKEREELRFAKNKKVSLYVRKSNTNNRFSRNLFGLFVENLGKCLYDGLLAEPDSGLENICGMRKDILDALKRIQIGVVRLPGGDYADNYHWMDGIGELCKRPIRVNGNWKMNDPNRFGTHEFMELCRYLDAEPHFVVNLGTGSVEEARAWIEYCNHPSGTELSELRAKNGSQEPFNVKYWGVGNEAFNRGGLMRPEYYADLYRNYAYFMRLMDSSIELVLSGAILSPFGWNEKVLELVCTGHRAPIAEHISVHAYWGYAQSQDYSENAYYETLGGLEDMKKRLEEIAELCALYSTDHQKIRLSIDEWAPWYSDAVDPLLEQSITMRDAIICARMLQYVAQMGDTVSMLCASVSINALLSLILTKGEKMSLTPAYYAYLLMSKHINGDMMEVEEEWSLQCIGPKESVPFVTSAATRSGNQIVVSLVNASLKEDVDVSIALEETVKHARVDWLESADIHDENLPGEEEKVSPKGAEIEIEDGKIQVTLKKRSVCMVTMEINTFS